ncbi:MAG: FKBP-type peptidyl-prolyl cis-trans isomerase [Candidatus Ancillula sp.]|jgi:peptidylprolyl isomerase|nr:FKBP-type peptidyl-prolyl cis-trans isomerase [Candidatus Ancillula sp.]
MANNKKRAKNAANELKRLARFEESKRKKVQRRNIITVIACAIAAFAVIVTFAVVNVNVKAPDNEASGTESKQARFDAYQNALPDPSYTPQVVQADTYEGTLPVIENQDATPSVTFPDGYTVPQDLVVSTLASGDGPDVDLIANGGKIAYSGWNLNGDEFDSSISQGREPYPVEAGLPNLIQGWTKGLAGPHKVGDKLMLVIPQSLSYPDKTLAGIDDTTASGPLVFFVEIKG